MICFLDLDGVLVDFMLGAHRFHDLEYSESSYPYKYSDWEVLPPVSSDMTSEEFWDSFDEDFWAGLPWKEDGVELLEMMEEFFGQENICLLSSPTLCPRSVSGKLKWIQNNLPQYSRQFLIGPFKGFCAHRKAVLVDDNDRNVEYFMNYGGFGVLVPRPWNSLYEHCNQAMKVVRDKLECLRERVWTI